MKKLLQFSGLLTWLAAIMYGFSYLIEYKPNIITIIYTVLSIVGVIAIIALIIRLIYGKDWFFNLGKEVVVGNDLIKATERFLGELPLPKKEATANFVGHLIYRFTRLGFIGLALAMIPIWLLYQQNNKIDTQNILITNQNKRLDQQTYLQEAERRSSLVFLFSNIMDAIDKELKEDVGEKEKRDLSPQLVGRVIALSTRLKPYLYLEGDSLISKPLSPERGQLLLSLVESQLDTVTLSKIFRKADFSSSDLESANLQDSYLKGIKLWNTDLTNSNLIGANLEDARLSSSDLSSSNLSNANLLKADMQYTKLLHVKFNNTNLQNAILAFADLYRALFQNADLQGAYLIEANLAYTLFDKTKMDSTIVDSNFFQKIQNILSFSKDSIESNYQLDSIYKFKNYTYYLKKQ